MHFSLQMDLGLGLIFGALICSRDGLSRYLPEQGRHIKNKGHAAISQDGGARDAGQISEEFAEGLDDGLVFSVQLLDDEPDAVCAVLDDDDVFPRARAPGKIK